MIKVPTEAGKTYCVSTARGCEVFVFVNSLDIKILTISGEGQGYFTAPCGFADCNDDEASVTECKGGFSVAPAGVSSGGGGALPKPGLAYVSGIPSVLTGDTVHDVGACPAALDLSALAFAWGGRVETCELWLTLDSINASVITFPGSWAWMDGVPSLNTPGKSYRIAIRREPLQVVANLAYSA